MDLSLRWLDLEFWIFYVPIRTDVGFCVLGLFVDSLLRLFITLMLCLVAEKRGKNMEIEISGLYISFSGL